MPSALISLSILSLVHRYKRSWMVKYFKPPIQYFQHVNSSDAPGFAASHAGQELASSFAGPQTAGRRPWIVAQKHQVRRGAALCGRWRRALRAGAGSAGMTVAATTFERTCAGRQRERVADESVRPWSFSLGTTEYTMDISCRDFPGLRLLGDGKLAVLSSGPYSEADGPNRAEDDDPPTILRHGTRVSLYSAARGASGASGGSGS